MAAKLLLPQVEFWISIFSFGFGSEAVLEYHFTRMKVNSKILRIDIVSCSCLKIQFINALFENVFFFGRWPFLLLDPSSFWSYSFGKGFFREAIAWFADYILIDFTASELRIKFESIHDCSMTEWIQLLFISVQNIVFQWIRSAQINLICKYNAF